MLGFHTHSCLRDAPCNVSGKHLVRTDDKHSIVNLASEMQAKRHLGKPSPHPLFSQRE